ncbi:MAG: pyridoxal-dependent decarboxylase, partial [Xanthomonadales bacterium]|nr:pyridoxal-dependent decarboxylase [Xanthomonadales bacterium]
MTTEKFETLDPENWDEMRELAHRMVEDAFDYIQSCGERPVWTPVPDDISQYLKEPAPADPSDPADVYDEFLANIMPYNLHTNHPRFWAWYMGSGTVMGAMADFLAAVLNPNVGGINHAAPRVEQQVISWLIELMGFPTSASGLLTSGASMANFTALTVARNSNCGYDVRRKGVLAAPGQLTAYASSEIHSCNQKAIETLGLGSQGLRKVPVNADYTIDMEALRDQV